MKKRLIILLFLMLTGCSREEKCENIEIDVSSYLGIIINGFERTKESNLDIILSDDIDSNLLGIWIAENKENDYSPTGDTYIFLKDGTCIKIVRFYYAQGQMYTGNYYIDSGVLYLKIESSEYYQYHYQIIQEESVLMMKYVDWKYELILNKVE